MTRTLVLTLALAAAGSLAQAQEQCQQVYPEMQPLNNRYYSCDYTNPHDHEKDPGRSVFNLSPYLDGRLLRGIESFEAIGAGGQVFWDARKVSFAFQRNVCRTTIEGDVVPVATVFELTKNPDGWRCTATVRGDGQTINVTGCDDGHSRFCRLQ